MLFSQFTMEGRGMSAGRCFLFKVPSWTLLRIARLRIETCDECILVYHFHYAYQTIETLSKLICFSNKLSNSNFILIQYVALSVYKKDCFPQNVKDDFYIVMGYLDNQWIFPNATECPIIIVLCPWVKF